VIYTQNRLSEEMYTKVIMFVIIFYYNWDYIRCVVVNGNWHTFQFYNQSFGHPVHFLPLSCLSFWLKVCLFFIYRLSCFAFASPELVMCLARSRSFGIVGFILNLVNSMPPLLVSPWSHNKCIYKLVFISVFVIVLKKYIMIILE
jgi:hypothetical protein